ncbi:Protein of uncharacterised function (DUF2974) [uncultured Clostridium sp.]|nr:Protein of uncharacterised function (DUF2974) [uncultured Clostridium sp.]SCJ01707.1 Protein of uncharacterised function (DUF2974) [uncultured Clostridium sp.]
MKIYKLFLILPLLFFTLGFNKLDTLNLLDESNPKWHIDSDEDGLPDAFEEILKTDKYNKDSDNDKLSDEEELKRGSNPLYKDYNRSLNYELSNEYIIDDFKSNKNIYVSEYMLFESADLASKIIEKNPIGKTIGEIFKDKYKSIKDFKVIRYENGERGFGGIALRCGNSLIVSYKPTRSYMDWIENFTTQFMPHPQRDYAIEFIKPLVNNDTKVYISGHSLGGLLAQYATYDLVNKGYKNVKTVTFNSANTLNPMHIKGKYAPPIIKNSLIKDYIVAYMNLIPKKNEDYIIDASYITSFLNKSIEYKGFVDINNYRFKKSDFKNYNNIVKNYIVSNDPLYLIINGGYLGKNKIKELGIEDIDVVKDKNKLGNYHKLENFIDMVKD